MNFSFPYKEYNPEDLIRRCGYGEITSFHTKETSYKRSLGSGHYPRFHVYIKKFEDHFDFSIHIDQKEVSYEGSTAHSGEYEGELVENEARRITSIIAGLYGVAI